MLRPPTVLHYPKFTPILHVRITTAIFALCCITTFAESPKVRVTTWNLEWFPNGSSKEQPADVQNVRINSAANVIRQLDPDIVLLQEVKDYDACARLAEAIRPGTYQVAICSSYKGGKQQEAILSKVPAQAAWYELWKSVEGTDPPRGFAFAWFKIGGADVGVYCVHLKSNRSTDKEANVRKREVAADQLLAHMHDIIATVIPSLTGFVVGGDFNTNKDQKLFSEEGSLTKFADAGLHSCFEGLPPAERVTHPGSGRYPNATFDYLLGINVAFGKPVITKSDASDHLPVTCEVRLSP